MYVFSKMEYLSNLKKIEKSTSRNMQKVILLIIAFLLKTNKNVVNSKYKQNGKNNPKFLMGQNYENDRIDHIGDHCESCIKIPLPCH